jgi:hypothetical protein
MDPELDDDEARVVVNGEPVQGADPLFIGSFEAAKAFILALSPEEQHEVSLFTPDRVYQPSELR